MAAKARQKKRPVLWVHAATSSDEAVLVSATLFPELAAGARVVRGWSSTCSSPRARRPAT